MIPKMTDVFKEDAEKDPTSNPAFKSWFKNSKVVDSSGRPLVMYHSSPRDIQAFRQYSDLGHHFGTKKAATDRMSFWDSDKTKGGSKNMYSVYLSIQKPLELPDLGVWEPSELVKILVDRGVMNAHESDRVLMKGDKNSKMEELRNVLKSKGYDGVFYTNTVEDKGSVSWIAFDGTQVKSTENKGMWDKRRASIYE